MLEENWKDCPMILEWERCRKTFLKELRERAWLKGQQRKLFILIQWMMAGENNPEKAYWSERLYNCFCRRFARHTKTDWISFLAGMNNCQAYGSFQQTKMKYYCIRLRDAAIVFTQKINEKELNNEWNMENAS